jgi:putative redox protein
MTNISATIGKQPYKIEIKSPSGNLVIADEPVDKGGKNLGFSPKELLASALAACTGATVRMYADQKGWNLEELHIQVKLIEEGDLSTFSRELELVGKLTVEQRARLLSVANACPVHKILTHTIKIETALI